MGKGSREGGASAVWWGRRDLWELVGDFADPIGGAGECERGYSALCTAACVLRVRTRRRVVMGLVWFGLALPSRVTAGELVLARSAPHSVAYVAWCWAGAVPPLRVRPRRDVMSKPWREGRQRRSRPAGVWEGLLGTRQRRQPPDRPSRYSTDDATHSRSSFPFDERIDGCPHAAAPPRCQRGRTPDASRLPWWCRC
jgi:hypothetical protein